jgi:DNA helicase INO80
MLSYWKRKDREIQELKKKRDKAEKEIKKKQDEERESMMQKKRLEFIMRKSEIYTHFMAKKLGVEEREKMERGEVEIDEQEAERAVLQIIKNREMQKKEFEVGKEEKEEREVEEVRLDTVDAAEGSGVWKQPSSFKGELKEYQIKGLRWLDSLYQQGINGILADEMGLGKTIQAISLLAHVSENKNDWGPFLIIAPSTTLPNWKNEIEKFCPGLRALPYWGTFSERKALRKFFNRKHLSLPYSPFHVVITSYQLIALDEKYFKRVRWHYMILDEAQAIKNFNSQRWEVLLNFESRNRLLLTGTPIQNTMAELWALLHFIMPDLFDSHDQFQEWFSKDIEAQALNDEGEISKRHLERLHKVLKPFMLRRVKKDVENELGIKKEYNEFCEMTY